MSLQVSPHHTIMGIFSRKKKEAKEKDEDFNPYGSTSMNVTENKFEAFKDYAAQKKPGPLEPRFDPVARGPQYKGNSVPVGADEKGRVGGPGGPFSAAQETANYEETYKDYKKRIAKEKSHNDQVAKLHDRLHNTNSGSYQDTKSNDFPYQEQDQQQQQQQQPQDANEGNAFHGGQYGLSAATYDEDDLNAPTKAFDPALNGGYGDDDEDLNAPSGGRYDYDNDYDHDQEHILLQQQPYQPELTEEEKAKQKEEEELEEIKGELSFTRDKSLASTQRTLELAREAELSGQNTMGMLGSQSTQVYMTENNLRLAHTQNRIGTERAKELRTAGDVFRAPKNPFNKKSRLKQREDKLRAEIIADKALSDQQRREFQQSERRIKENLYVSSKNGTAEERKTRDAALEQHRKYLFDEEDSEEEEKELQIGHNMNEIHGYALRLRKLAQSQGNEVDKQNERLRTVEDSMDTLDIGVQQNKDRLYAITHK